jgi:AraC-like DNA-binding protein
MAENALFLLPALRRARDLIDRDYAEPLDLDAMARQAGYSRFQDADEAPQSRRDHFSCQPPEP